MPPIPFTPKLGKGTAITESLTRILTNVNARRDLEQQRQNDFNRALELETLKTENDQMTQAIRMIPQLGKMFQQPGQVAAQIGGGDLDLSGFERVQAQPSDTLANDPVFKLQQAFPGLEITPEEAGNIRQSRTFPDSVRQKINVIRKAKTQAEGKLTDVQKSQVVSIRSEITSARDKLSRLINATEDVREELEKNSQRGQRIRSLVSRLNGFRSQIGAIEGRQVTPFTDEDILKEKAGPGFIARSIELGGKAVKAIGEAITGGTETESSLDQVARFFFNTEQERAVKTTVDSLKTKFPSDNVVQTGFGNRKANLFMGTTFKPGAIMSGVNKETKDLILNTAAGQTIKAMIGDGVSEEGIQSFITTEIEDHLDEFPALTIREVLRYRDFVTKAFAKWQKLNSPSNNNNKFKAAGGQK